jgi:uncharacterized iron-regulated protein
MCCNTVIPAAASEPFIVDLLMGEPIPLEMALDDLATVRVVYVGEVHTIERHHELETAILKGLADRNLKLALGMEMFTESQQTVLDTWQRGDKDVSSLMKELGHDQWTNLKEYEPLLLFARKQRIPILGLNAASNLVRSVARNGLEGLSPEEKALVPPDLEQTINPLNDRLLRLRLKVHKAFQGKGLDRVVLAQTLRDETMGRVVARFLDSPEGKGRIMMVVAGNGHMNYGFGIPERVRSRLNVPYRIVLASDSGELVLSPEEKRQSVPVEITHQDLSFIRVPIADYLNVIPLKEKEGGEGSTDAVESL